MNEIDEYIAEFTEHRRGCRATADSDFGEACDCGLDAAMGRLRAALAGHDTEWRRAALQARKDLEAAPVDLGLPADTRWVDYSNEANTIRWIDRLEILAQPSEPARQEIEAFRQQAAPKFREPLPQPPRLGHGEQK